MATLYTHQDSNIAKTWILMTLFFVVVITLGWFFSVVLDQQAILYVAVFFSIAMNIGSYWFSDKLVIAMTRAKPVTRESAPDLWNVVENLSITAGLPMPKVYIVEDPAPNAFATGRNPEHAAVAATTGLLAIMNKTELEGVIAHELSHVGNRDSLLMTSVVVLVGFVTLLSDFFMRSMMWGGNRGGDRDRGNAQAIFMIIGVVLAILSPIIATLIQLAISRRREFLADASGALLTRYPEGLAAALEKLKNNARPMQTANRATAHLFISNPFGGNGVLQGMSKLFMTHPPLEERIKALLNN